MWGKSLAPFIHDSVYMISHIYIYNFFDFPLDASRSLSLAICCFLIFWNSWVPHYWSYICIIILDSCIAANIAMYFNWRKEKLNQKRIERKKPSILRWAPETSIYFLSSSMGYLHPILIPHSVPTGYSGPAGSNLFLIPWNCAIFYIFFI